MIGCKERKINKGKRFTPIFIVLMLIISGCATATINRRRITPKHRRYFTKTLYSANQNNDKNNEFISKSITHFFKDSVNQHFYTKLFDMDLWDKRIVFKNAYNAYRNKEYSKAIKGFKKAMKQFPILKDYSLFYQALCYEKKENFQKAASLLSDCIEGFPKSPIIPEANLMLAEIHFFQGEYNDAIKGFENCLNKFQKEEAYIRYQIALCNLNIDNKKEALKWLKEIIISYPDSQWSRLAEGHLYILMDNGNAEMICKRDNDQIPSPYMLFSPDEQLKRADNLYRTKRYSAAIEAYQSLIMEDAFPPQIQCRMLFNIAKSQKGLGNDDLVVDKLTEIIETMSDPQCTAGPRLYLARKLWNQDRDNEARAHFEYLLDITEITDLKVEVSYLLGRMAEENGEYSEAIKYFQSIIDMANTGKFFENSLWRIGWIYYLMQNYSYALAHFELHLHSIKDTVLRHQFLYWIARSEEKMGHWDTAVHTYHKILNEDYWSYYSGLALERLEYGQDYFHPYFYFIEEEMFFYDPFPLLDNQEMAIVDQAQELFLLGLKKEASNEIQSYVNSQKPLSPQLIYSLAILAHAYQAHDLGIKLGILFKSKNSLHKGKNMAIGNLLLYPAGFCDEIFKEASEQQLDPILILSIMRQESLFDPFALSSASAYGLMQVIPPTGRESAQELGIEFPANISELYEIGLNLTLGCYYVKKMLERFNNNNVYAVAAYNGGPNAVQKWQERYGEVEMDEFIESISYPETKGYVKRVMRNYFIYSRLFNMSPSDG